MLKHANQTYQVKTVPESSLDVFPAIMVNGSEYGSELGGVRRLFAHLFGVEKGNEEEGDDGMVEAFVRCRREKPTWQNCKADAREAKDLYASVLLDQATTILDVISERHR